MRTSFLLLICGLFFTLKIQATPTIAPLELPKTLAGSSYIGKSYFYQHCKIIFDQRNPSKYIYFSEHEQFEISTIEEIKSKSRNRKNTKVYWSIVEDEPRHFAKTILVFDDNGTLVKLKLRMAPSSLIYPDTALELELENQEQSLVHQQIFTKRRTCRSLERENR